MTRAAAIRVSRPDATIDPAVEEMRHSLFDGRARYKADQSSDNYRSEMNRLQHRNEDSTRSKVTLATLEQSYLA